MEKRKIQQGDIVPIKISKSKIVICRAVFISLKVHRIVQLGVCELIDKSEPTLSGSKSVNSAIFSKS